MRSLSLVCDRPEPQVAHRALICAASARPRMPTSTTTTLSVIRRPAAAQERARRRWSAGWHKNTHRTPPRSAMAFRARCFPTFSTRLRPPSLHLITTSPPPHHHLITTSLPPHYRRTGCSTPPSRRSTRRQGGSKKHLLGPPSWDYDRRGLQGHVAVCSCMTRNWQAGV